MAQVLNDFVAAAVQDLLKQPASGVDLQDTAAGIEKKKKNAQAQTGDNAVLQGGVGAVFGGAASSLLNRSGNQY